VTTEWKEAPKVCYFCDQTGHIKKDCAQFQEAKNLRLHYQEFKKKSVQNKTPIKNPTEDNPYMEEVENLLTQEETQNMDMNETCSQEQVTEEVISDYEMDDKTDTVCTEISIENNLNTTQGPAINNTNLENAQPNGQEKVDDSTFTLVVRKKRKPKDSKPYKVTNKENHQDDPKQRAHESSKTK
jgi:hypothetical protein